LTDEFLTFPALTRTQVGAGGYYYERAVSRWLPVFRQAVSPDGRRYAYTEGWAANPPVAPRVHIVDAATGADMRVVTMPNAAPYSVIDFTDRFVYLGIRYEANPPGYWSVDPATGAVAKVSDRYYQPAGAGWSGAVDPRDPNPYRSPFNGELGNNRIDYRDAAGLTTTWFYRPGRALNWVAFSGPQTLLVQVAGHGADPSIGGIEYWLVTGPNQSAQIASYSYSQPSPYLDLMNGFLSAIADAHGIWIGGLQSLYLVKPNGEIRRVYGESAYPANTCI
jgi:hypothetical protein